MLPKKRILLFSLAFLLLFQVGTTVIHAQAANPSPRPNPDAPLDRAGSNWAPNAEVATVAKGIRRSQDFLDWMLRNGNVKRNGYGPITANWIVVRNTTYILAVLLIVAVGFLLMIRRNKDITLIKFLPLFIGLMAYVTFSFAITRQVYQLTEGMMKYFYRLDAGDVATNRLPRYIQTQDLLHVDWDYENNEWQRRTGLAYDESADISLLLTRVTTWTYMSMSGILILRQVILWFFIIVSPFLALLLPFPLIRNTAKIWVGEFFRWLLYGLLFSVFLRGLVEIWQRGIPLQFANTADTIVYPNAVNYQLAGPNYALTRFDPLQGYSGVHDINTYVNYVVALIMLWVVVILPWILLRIFRDMLGAWLKSDSANNLMGQIGTLYSKHSPGGESKSQPVGPREPNPPLSPAPAGFGKALELPFRKVNIVARDVAVNQDIQNNVTVDRGITEAATNEITKMLGMAVPKITDVARMEMNSQQMEAAWGNLQKLGNPATIALAAEQQKMANMRSELTKRASAGDERAQNILQAAQSAAAVSSSAAMGSLSQRAAIGTLQTSEAVTKGAAQGAAAIAAAMAGGSNAQKIVSQAKAGAKNGGRIMPVVNKVQSVSLNDYEEVKKMWVDHYKKGELPAGSVENRKEWIKQDIEKAETAVSMLGNINPQTKQRGLELVAALLPFLLLGGFSEQETIAYLKAKTEAAKQVLTEMEAQEQGKKQAQTEEEETLELTNKKQEAQAAGHLAAEVPEEPPPASAEAIETQAVSDTLTTNDVTKPQ